MVGCIHVLCAWKPDRLHVCKEHPVEKETVVPVDEELKELVRKSYEVVKAAYKREKSDARISSSERKQARLKAKAKYRKHG